MSGTTVWYSGVMPATFPRRRRPPNWLRLGCLLLAAGLPSAENGRAAPPSVRVELTGGEAVSGSLLEINAEALRIEIAGQARDISAADVRRLVRDDRAAGPRPRVLVTTRGGGLLDGGDGYQEGERWVLDRPEGPISLPLDRVARVAWLAEGEEEPAWLADMPAQPTADLVVIRKDDGHTFVECAVTAVSGDAVSVVLDGETIPVKRAKVAGIVWLREPVAAARGPVVTFSGGRLTATSLRWSEEDFVVDGTISLPPAVLESIDYAVARTIPLAVLEADATEVEPAFGQLADVAGLAGFFAPRAVATGGDAPPDLAVRPRTVATWRVPANARRFRARLIRDVPDTSPALVEVSLAVDGQEAFRSRLGPAVDRRGDDEAAKAIVVDVSTVRRLTLTVDFAGGSLGCPVRLIEPVFEQ
jgi:hypothetical protein